LIEICRVVDTVLIDQETIYAPRHGKPRSDWLALMPNAPEGYVSWEKAETIRKMVSRNVPTSRHHGGLQTCLIENPAFGRRRSERGQARNRHSPPRNTPPSARCFLRRPSSALIRTRRSRKQATRGASVRATGSGSHSFSVEVVFSRSITARTLFTPCVVTIPNFAK
jgi:hypothetical protein